jgi:hypothetical protein
MVFSAPVHENDVNSHLFVAKTCPARRGEFPAPAGACAAAPPPDACFFIDVVKRNFNDVNAIFLLNLRL